MMQFKQCIRGRTFAANVECEGIFELIGGAYQQHRPTDWAHHFYTAESFRRFVLKMLRESADGTYWE